MGGEAVTETELSELDAEMVELGVWLEVEMVAISKFIEGLNVDELAQNQFDNDDEADT